MILSGCNNIGITGFDNVEEDTESSGNNESGRSSITFAGISSLDQVSDTAVRLNWTNHSEAVGYQVFNVTSGTPVFVSFIIAPINNATVSRLTPATTYSYRVKAQDSGGLLDNNTNDQGFTTTSVPETP